MISEKVKVLYIAGTMRSGSTLLGRLLAEMPEAVAVGELGLLFSPYLWEHGRCGCLQKVRDCPFWQAVFERAFGGIDSLDIAALHEIRQDYRFRTLPRLLVGRRALARDTRFQEYIQALDALYRAVQEVSGARVIVDASKDPLYVSLLQQAPNIDLRATHLVRDSRAVAFSQQRIKSDPPGVPDPGQLLRVKPLRTAITWNVVNALLTFQVMGTPVLRLRYEDFAEDPASALRRLWTLMEEPEPNLDFLGQSPLSLHTSHTVAGNPDRFQPEVSIRPDLEWQQKMPLRDRWLVTVLTFPGLLHYGFLQAKLPAKEKKRIQPARVL